MPFAHFARASLRGARTKQEAVEIGLRLVRELEEHKAWIRAQGFIPPKFFIMKSEQIAKGWPPAVPCGSKVVWFAKEEPPPHPNRADDDATI